MPIMIDELHTRIRPEQEDTQAESAGAPGAADIDAGTTPGGALAAQIQRELRIREERRLRWQAD